ADTGGSGIDSVQFQVKGPGDSSFSDLGAPDTSAPYQLAWDTTGVADDSYDLRVVTTDGAGNATASSARTVLVDNTAPTGALTQPADGAQLRATVTLASSSDDDGSGVASAQFQVEGSGDSSFSDLGAP